MKFLKLEILNLASLDREGGEVINFEEGVLGDSNLFSIVGPTGSGKSTLLDAICLALYNRAPRYPRKKGERNQNIEIFGKPDNQESNRLAPTDSRNILTRGKKEGYSKLTFLANNGCVYRAEWYVKFQRVRYSDPVTLLYKITQVSRRPEEEPAEWEKLAQIIGLDYDQFLRTVLIAQGSFANFLTAKENERYELLEKLIGCEEMYTRIAAEIKNKKDVAVDAYNAINADVEVVKQYLLSDEDLLRLKEETARLEQEEKERTEALKKTETALRWYADDEQQLHIIGQQEKQVEQARRALAAIDKPIERLRLHDAIAPATALWREKIRLEKVIYTLKADIEKKGKHICEQEAFIAEGNKRLAAMKERAMNAQKLLEEKTPHINKARELSTQIKAANIALAEKLQTKEKARKEKDSTEKAVEENEKRIAEATKEESRALQAIGVLQENIGVRKQELACDLKKAEERLETEKQKIEGQNADELQQHKAAADKAVADLKRASDLSDKQTKAQEEKAQILNRRDVLWQENAGFEKEQEQLAIDVLTQEVETLRKTYTLMTSENWMLHRTRLESGKPCPLCGSTEHPYRKDESRFEETTSALQALLNGKDAELKRQQKLKEDLSGRKKANEGELKGVTARLKQLDEDRTAFIGERNSLLLAYPELPETKEEIDIWITKQEDRQRQTEESLKYYNKVQKEITELSIIKDRAVKAQSDYEKASHEALIKAQQEANKATTTLTSLKTLTATLLAQKDEKQKALSDAEANWQKATEERKILQEAFKSELDGADPDETEKQLKQAKEHADRLATEQAEEMNRCNNRLGEAKGSMQAQQKQWETELENRMKKEMELAAWINEYNNRENRIRTIVPDDVKLMAEANDAWDEIRKEQEARIKALTSAEALLKNANILHAEHQASRPEKNREELAVLQQEIQAKSHQQELVAAKAKRTNHENALKMLGDKAEVLKRATNEKNDWTGITDAIGTDGKTLRKIAQCYTLRFLIEHANAEIRKFNGRYELQQVKNSLGIRVVDHDRADDVRDTTSLSGGETFIVSLGLALGLSSLSSRNISFDNLFIDEGFGTLDPDMLATVIDSLAMLQSSQGKKVGVISHTDTMSERITTQIRVIKNGNSGSSHIEIYPQ